MLTADQSFRGYRKKRDRNPVIVVRVPAPLHARIIESAKISGRSMSEEAAWLLALNFFLSDRVEAKHAD